MIENTSSMLQEAFQLRKQKKTSEALAIYQQLHPTYPHLFGEWEWWSFAQCLRELRRFEEALEICRIGYKKFPDAEMLKQLYAWCIFYTQLAGDKKPVNDAIFIKAVEGIVLLSPPGQPYSPAVKSIFKLIKHLSVKPNTDWKNILHWLNKMDVHLLSHDTYEVEIPGKKKKTELASEVEEWYSWQSKCLLQTGDWAACITLCDDAAKNIKKWHYSNQIWFERRKAAALVGMGRNSEAVTLLEKLLARKREWFMLADLAQITINAEKAQALMAEAILMPGDQEKKVKLLQQFANSLYKNGHKQQARQVALYDMALRHHNNWPLPAETATLLSQTGDIPATVPLAKEFWPDVTAVCKQCLANQAVDNRKSGMIKSLLPDKKIGFIQPDKGAGNIFFAYKSFAESWQKFAVGKLVTYAEVASYNAKKQQNSVAAIDIKLKEN